MTALIALTEVDEVDVTLVVDNAIDALLPSSSVTRRMNLGPNPFDRPVLPVAQHGFSALIRVRQGTRQGSILFDTGVSSKGILDNLDALEIDLHDVRSIVLSHGHADHALGLEGVIKRLGRRSMPLLLHPDAYLERKFVLPNGAETHLPAPRMADLRRDSIEVIEEVGPSMLIDNMLLVSGEVARTTTFETGMQGHVALRRHGWEPDPLIMDDQCVVVNVRSKGLVIVTGCGHAGIINIIRNAQAVTGVKKIHAVIGGFHLPGDYSNPRIAPTVAALQNLAPDYIMPGHCTGWAAKHSIAQALPEAFLANSVGTTVQLRAEA